MNRRAFLQMLGIGTLSAPVALAVLAEVPTNDKRSVAKTEYPVIFIGGTRDLTVGELRQVLIGEVGPEIVWLPTDARVFRPGDAL